MVKVIENGEYFTDTEGNKILLNTVEYIGGRGWRRRTILELRRTVLEFTAEQAEDLANELLSLAQELRKQRNIDGRQRNIDEFVIPITKEE